jgi:hypothetical protein
MSSPVCAVVALALAAWGPAPRSETLLPDAEPGSEHEPEPEPRNERLRWRGTGALVIGSLAGAAGLGLGIGTARQVAALEGCTTCGERSFALPFAAIALNTAAFSLISLGTGLRARDEGLQFADEGKPRRVPNAAIGLGGLFLGGGALLVAGALAWRLLDEPRSTGTPWAILQGGMSLIVVGSGLVVYGSTYRRFAGPRLGQVRVVPNVSWQHAGLAIAGTF